MEALQDCYDDNVKIKDYATNFKWVLDKALKAEEDGDPTIVIYYEYINGDVLSDLIKDKYVEVDLCDSFVVIFL